MEKMRTVKEGYYFGVKLYDFIDIFNFNYYLYIRINYFFILMDLKEDVQILDLI